MWRWFWSSVSSPINPMLGHDRVSLETFVGSPQEAAKVTEDEGEARMGVLDDLKEGTKLGWISGKIVLFRKAV